MLFKKKKPRKWEFEEFPIVDWKATNKSKFDMTTVCKIIMTQILDIKNVSLMIVNDDRMVGRFDNPDIELQAVLYGYPQLKKYVLYLKRNLSLDLLSIVCHEMIHLKQYAEGKLRLEGVTFYWNGKAYKSSVPYFDRPWEIEANAKMNDVEKKVRELYYE